MLIRRETRDCCCSAAAKIMNAPRSHSAALHIKWCMCWWSREREKIRPKSLYFIICSLCQSHFNGGCCFSPGSNFGIFRCGNSRAFHAFLWECVFCNIALKPNVLIMSYRFGGTRLAKGIPATGNPLYLLRRVVVLIGSLIFIHAPQLLRLIRKR